MALGFWSKPLGWADAAFAAVAVVLFVGSRDNLRSYYDRVVMLLGGQSPEEPEVARPGPDPVGDEPGDSDE
jgi:hypothetical protein